MIKVENVEVFNFDGAIRGMRNPLQSHSNSDSGIGCEYDLCSKCGYVSCKKKYQGYHIGEADLDLIHRLYVAGSDGNFAHRKFLRQIFVCMDITAPDFFFKEFSTYKVGVTENSTSTMHTIHKRDLALDDFSHEHLIEGTTELSLKGTIELINRHRRRFVESGDKEEWYQIIQLLPMSYNYTRTVTFNYENVANMIQQRSGHKLDEWRSFVETLKNLPYVKEIMEGM